ncbi:MAG: thymidine phosphorylase, partial [Kiritimatiellia bacterium]
MGVRMIAKLVLDKKREGRALGSAEIREFVEGYTRGEIPDCQMSALAMAICCRGMTERETADLTEAMKNSGRCLEWNVATADKHSTGGVGDNLSLVVQPLAAACGVCVPSLTGRGLGLTGGTADKLETIPGYSCAQPLERFQSIAQSVGVSLSVQTDEIAPADKKIYALRDVTGTVASIPLIVASILSKKLAEGAGTLVFDVKCGRGAFMKTRAEARTLADALVAGARAAGRKAAALVTAMDAPLGFHVGNANEVAAALRTLANAADPRAKAVTDLCVELAALMVSLAQELPLDEARRRCGENLANGRALERFRAMVAAHGGDLTRFGRLLAKPTFKFRIQAMKS